MLGNLQTHVQEKMNQTVNAIGKWYNGEYIPKPPKITASLVIIDISNRKRHWTANTAHSIVEFIQVNWMWLISITVSILKDNGSR